MFHFRLKSSIDDLNIQKCSCVKFILDKEERCHCGLLLNEHKRQDLNQNSSGKWTINTCTQADGPTDAYGDVMFVSNNNNIAKVNIHENIIQKNLVMIF